MLFGLVNRIVKSENIISNMEYTDYGNQKRLKHRFFVCSILSEKISSSDFILHFVSYLLVEIRSAITYIND